MLLLHARGPRVFLLAALVVLCSIHARSQTNYGAVRGLVNDPQGAILSGATVTLINQDTDVSHMTTTNNSGEYLFTAVDPGTYVVTIEDRGFKKVEQAPFTVGIGTTQTVDFKLELGQASQEVEVTAALEPLIDTASASLGQTFDQQKLQDLPNLGRNPFVFDKLDNNVTPTGDPRFVRAEDQSGTTAVSLAGAPVGGSGINASNDYVVDGIPVSTSSGGATFIPSLEAIQDAKVEADTYDAEIGRAGGGVFNTTLKSGSSSYHGTLYGETRQTPWLANTWANNSVGIARPDGDTYLYAGAFGGPAPFSHKIKYLKDTFFWVSEEGYRQAQPYTATTTSYYVPTPQERLGNFSSDGITLYDPRTFPRVPLAGNIIPPDLINPIGQYIVNQFPACTTCTPYGAAPYNFSGSNDFKTRSDMYSGKLDHVFTPWWSSSASYVHLATQEPNGSILNVFAESDGVIHRFNDATAWNNVFTLNPTTILTAGYGFNRYYSNTLQYSSGFNQTNGFGGSGFPQGYVSQLQSHTFPNISLSSVTNATGLGAATSGPTIQYSKNLVVGVVKTLGKHSLKSGFVFRSMNDFVSSASGGNGSYNFSGQYSDATGAPSTNSPYSIADLIMGLPGGSISSGSPYAATTTINAVGLNMNAHYYALYAQDDFRLNEKLTINVGLRYEYEPGQREATNRYNVGFDPSISYGFPSSAAPTVNGGLAFAGVGKYPIHCCNQSDLKFAPRGGFAYQIKPGTVLRGGAGVFFAGVGLSPYSTGYSQVTAYTNSSTTAPVTGVGPNAWLSNPFPAGLLTPTGNTLGPLSGVGGSVTAQSFGRRFPLVDQYSLQIERQLPAGFVMNVGWVGAHARNWGQPVNIDQVPDATMASYAAGGANAGTSLATKIANPYYAPTIGGYPSTGTVAGTTVARAQTFLPYPQFSGVTLEESNGESRYNAMDLKIQKQMSRGFTILATYTWSSNWDNLYNTTSTLNESTAGLQDNYNLKAEYARSVNDMPNRVTAAVTYEVPLGRGKQYFSDMNRWLDYAVGGWQINDEWIAQNGSPIAIVQTNLNSGGTYGATGVGGTTQRPNMVPGVNPCYSGRPQGRDTVAHPYFNLSAFSAALPYTYGDAPRTLPCQGPGYDNQDISIFKDFKVAEKVKFQFRAEALNAMNTPELALTSSGANTIVIPSGYTLTSASTTPSSTGVITTSLGFGRIIQLGGRITF
jgi:trimeric autotransporter adhesin